MRRREARQRLRGHEELGEVLCVVERVERDLDSAAVPRERRVGVRPDGTRIDVVVEPEPGELLDGRVRQVGLHVEAPGDDSNRAIITGAG